MSRERVGGLGAPSPLPGAPVSPQGRVPMQPPSLERPSLQLTEKAVNEAARGSEGLVCVSSSADNRVLSRLRRCPAWVPRSRRPLCPSEAPCLAYHPGQWPLDAVGCAALSWGKGREELLTYEDLD